MYYHFPTSDMTSTLHLHICMNRPMGALERYRAYDLDDIIQHLSQVSRVRACAARQATGVHACVVKEES